MIRWIPSSSIVQTLVIKSAKRLPLLTAPSPKLPKLGKLLLPCTRDGGRPPPLAGGCGIGEGEVCGDIMRGFAGLLTASELEELLGGGMAFVVVDGTSGCAPNFMSLPPFDMPATGPPLIYPEAPAALIVTEGLRLWSPTPDVELVGVLPLASGPTAGVAGGIAILPFTGELISGLPYWDVPVVTGEAVLPEAGGGEKGFFVALA